MAGGREGRERVEDKGSLRAILSREVEVRTAVVDTDQQGGSSAHIVLQFGQLGVHKA